MKTTRNRILIGLLIGLSASAQPEDIHGPGWMGVRCKGVEVGLSEQQVDHTLRACRLRGMSAEETDALLQAVYAAHKEGLPANNICIKIEEGLAKRVATEQIAAAANTRLHCLREARRLVASLRPGMGRGPGGMGGGMRHGMGSGNPDGPGPGQGRMADGSGPPHLIENLGVALESGVPADLFREVFSHAGHARMGRIMPVVDAAETLHLAGLKPEQIQRLLVDVVDRDLNRHAIQNLVEVVQRELADGNTFDTVYRALWTEKK